MVETKWGGDKDKQKDKIKVPVDSKKEGKDFKQRESTKVSDAPKNFKKISSKPIEIPQPVKKQKKEIRYS